MPRVRIVQQANWRGRHFLPGAELIMDQATAAAYCRAGQAVVLPELPATEAREAAAIAAKPAVERPGASVETARLTAGPTGRADAEKGERRKRKPKRA